MSRGKVALNLTLTLSPENRVRIADGLLTIPGLRLGRQNRSKLKHVMSTLKCGEPDTNGNLSDYRSDGLSEEESHAYEPRTTVTYNARGFRTAGGKARPSSE